MHNTLAMYVNVTKITINNYDLACPQHRLKTLDKKKKLKLVLPGLRPWTQVPDISAGQEETENHVPYVRHAVAPN